jgi:hypothetical protein
VVAMKTGIGDISQFVILNKNEQKIFVPGFINDSGMISVQGSIIVWNEYGYDPRWNVRNYSLIKAYDIEKKKLLVIGGKKSRYTSAAISPDGSKIAAIKTGTDYKTQMVVLSFPDGRVLNEFNNPENNFYSMPRWSDDGNRIVSLKTTSAGRTIIVVDFQTGVEKEVMPTNQENVGYPLLYKDYVLFNSPVTGIDNIYALDLKTGDRFQITSSKYGAYNPGISIDGKTIYYNDQSKDGLDAVQIPFDPFTWKRFEKRQPESGSYQHLVEQEGNPDLFRNIPQPDLSVTDFSKVSGIVNPYTWGFYVNNSLTEGNIGVTSQDLLSTLRIEAGYNFNISERTSSFQAGVSYQAFYPIIDVKASLAKRSVNEDAGADRVNFQWNEKTIEAGLRVPLVTTSSRFAGNVSFGNSVGLTSVSEFHNNFDNGGRIVNGYFFNEYADDGNLVYNNLSVTGQRLLKRSRRDINSKWGQRLNVEYFSTPYGGHFDGRLFAITGYLYLPGLARHHSLWGYGSFQDSKIQNISNNYVFQNEVPIPRGIPIPRFPVFYSSSVNYTLPIWYPDISIGPLLNIQRLRANLFLDYAFGDYSSIGIARQYASTGVEAKVDLNIFRFLPQIDIGVRYSQGLKPVVSKFEVLIGTINL